MGAADHLLEDAPRDELVRAFHATVRGEAVLARTVALLMKRCVQRPLRCLAQVRWRCRGSSPAGLFSAEAFHRGLLVPREQR
ncbi:hypothetical protein SAMN04488564_113271 [Lentzea waywayandensis]|uniref:Uncharacterized protein n=1 Tax=Lentzea waywayandensis TaxID=84724 RepID=A0A1I6FER6_9PSEU|nr:hypothetical protein [Lentzea waywayandensis]SFR28423.1 hypothetical protein SAMN04488564_113271 [Lentzea waywayandensis]